jgi:hypothetical protein
VVSTFAAAGIIKKRWRTVGDTCPYCKSMDGRVVSIQDAFLNKGSYLYPKPEEGFLRPAGDIAAAEGEGMLIKRRISHPPAHDGCDCITVAEV